MFAANAETAGGLCRTDKAAQPSKQRIQMFDCTAFVVLLLARYSPQTDSAEINHKIVNCEFCILNCFVPSPPHSIQRLLRSACCGLPRQRDGSLVGRRCERQLVVFFAFFRFGVCRECPVALSVGGAPDGQRYVGVPVGRRSRALRPSICRKLPPGGRSAGCSGISRHKIVWPCFCVFRGKSLLL